MFAEANEAILQHSDTVESIINRQKVTKELIFNYLHWKKVNTDSNRDKKSLSNLLTDYWKEQLQTRITPENVQSTNENSTTRASNQCVIQVL